MVHFSCMYNNNFQLHEEEDRNYTLTTRKEELENELNDLKFDLEKAQRLTNKLDYKIYCMSKEDGNKDHVHEHGSAAAAAAKTNKQNGQINGGGPSGNSNKQVRKKKNISRRETPFRWTISNRNWQRRPSWPIQDSLKSRRTGTRYRKWQRRWTESRLR